MIKRMFLITLLTVVVFLVILILTLRVYSPGKIYYCAGNENVSESDCIAEKTFISVGGIKQGMIIRSKNLNNPVLLYIHGGPAFPNYFLIDKYNPELEDHFTVCYWEQRGGGLSYSNQIDPATMNLNQFVQDAIEVTNYLRERFNKEKIYMIAHSGGTPIGLMAAHSNPELYHAYIAMAQITNQFESEKIAYKYILEQYAANHNKRLIKRIQQYDALASKTNMFEFFRSVVRDDAMHKLGIGTMHEMKSVFRDIFMQVWKCKAYSIREKINIWKAKIFFLPKTNIIKEVFDTDFTEKIDKLDIPVYFISGKYDLTVNINLSKEYLNKLDAPIKGFYTFQHSAHSPLFEESEKMKRIIETDILNGKITLADEN